MTLLIPPRANQSGLMLLLLSFILGLAASACLVQVLNAHTMKIERDRKTAIALAEAKAALIGRAVADDNRPGSLPCPDRSGDGSADLFAGIHCPAYIGRFPWKTLGTDHLVDGSDEALWYALSANYRDHAAAEPINGTAPGSLEVDGASDIVAIILAPGYPLNRQTGRSSNNVADYLEGENADGDNAFSQQTSSMQNDRLITISRSELMATIAQRVLREVRGDAGQGMAKYFATAAVYPFADVNGDGNADLGQLSGNPSYQSGPDSLFFPGTTLSLLQNNAWFSQIHYAVAGDHKTASLELHGKSLAIAP